MRRRFFQLIGTLVLMVTFVTGASATETVTLYDNMKLPFLPDRGAGPDVFDEPIAQPFLTGEYDNVLAVEIDLNGRRGSATGDLSVEIWDDNGSGVPGNRVGVLGVLDMASLSNQWTHYLFDNPVTGLRPHTKYFVLLDFSAGSHLVEVATYESSMGSKGADLLLAKFRSGNNIWQPMNNLYSGNFFSYMEMTVFTDPRPAEAAAYPIPENESADVTRDIVLTWTPGIFAATHDIYLGTSWEDVNDASRNDPRSVLLSQAHPDTHIAVDTLEFDQTYYWRIDEVNAAPDHTVYKGEVWSFTAEPYSIPIENVQASASSQNSDVMGPENTINGTGLNELDQHSITATEMWLSGSEDPTPWIQYEFDKIYKLDLLSVWNSNQLIEPFLGVGAKDVVIETSVDGTEWTVLEGASLFNQATGTRDYAANTDIDFGGIMARHVKITINTGYGVLPQYGISEVRFFAVPVWARQAEPGSGEITEGTDVVLKWRAGREAVSHQVYFSPDSAAVTDATALLGTTNTPSVDLNAQGLELGSTYYWRVDEVPVA